MSRGAAAGAPPLAALLPLAAVLLSAWLAWEHHLAAAALAGVAAGVAAGSGLARSRKARIALAAALAAPAPLALAISRPGGPHASPLARALRLEAEADALRMAGDLDPARDLLAEAARSTPSAVPLAKLAWVHLKAGRPGEADAALHAALEAPDAPDARARLEQARDLLAGGRLDLALVAIERAADDAEPFDGLR